MNIARIAALRPSTSAAALATLLGKRWSPPDAHGHVPGLHTRGFGLQLDVDGNLARVCFYKAFAQGQLIEGLHIGMPLAPALAARVGLTAFANGPDDPPEWSQYRDRTELGHDLIVRFRNDAILALEIIQPGAVYPQPAKLLADPQLTRAYDFIRDPQMPQPKTARGSAWAGGWSLGLPPGISPEQWPLSPAIGHPMRHAFTVHVPADYRMQGAEWVALSLFVDDQFEELPACDAIEAFFAAALPSDAPEASLLPFWKQRSARHAGRFEMSDILGTHYVALWLTQAQFDAALCTPPDLRGNPLLGPAPEWLDSSYAAYFPHMPIRNPGVPAYALHSGEGRAAGIATAFPIRAQLREGDPNVGKPPREWENQCQDSGYIPFASDSATGLGLERLFGRNHLGGTMFAQQSYPEFGPHYLEFEEDFGGFNFGGGNAQIDLISMKLDWACG